MSTEPISTTITPAVVEQTIKPVEPTEEVSIAIVEETAQDPTVLAGELLSSPVEPPKTTEEEGVVNATLSKRRTIFNPFGRSGKKEDEKKTPTTSKGFGSLFSRPKSGSKIEEPEVEQIVSTELPQIEQLQPIEDIHVEPTVQDSVKEIVTTIETEVAEVTHTVEEAITETVAAVKRQSFISKFFGKKKAEVTTAKEVVEPATEAVEAEIPHDEAITKDVEHARPSSPLGKLTELFSSKKSTKKAKVEEETNKEVTPAATEDPIVEEPVKETSVTEAAPAVVAASA